MIMKKNTFKFNNNRSIGLIGKIGVVKTSIGKLLSNAPLLPFYDSDNELESTLDLSMNDSLETYRKKYFRPKKLKICDS